ATLTVRPSSSYCSEKTRSTINACQACSRMLLSSFSEGFLPVFCWKESLACSTRCMYSSKVISSPAISPTTFLLLPKMVEFGPSKSPPTTKNIKPTAITSIARPVLCLIFLIKAILLVFEVSQNNYIQLEFQNISVGNKLQFY